LQKWINTTQAISSINKEISLTWTLFLSPNTSHEWVINILKSAKYSIAIWWYQITDKEFIHVLKQKADQWVVVRIILEKSTYWWISKEYTQFIKQIQNTRIQIKSDEHLWINFQHAKTILIDSNSFLVSSANYSYWWFFNNREHWFYSHEPNHSKALSTLFDIDWSEQKEQIPPLLNSLRICPFNCREQLTQFIDSAINWIDIQAQYLEDEQLIDQLIMKKSWWISLRIIVWKYQENTLPSTLQESVRIMDDPNVHAKSILIDWSKLYLWSMNLSKNAVEKNREIGIVTNDRYVIRQFLWQFDKDRQSISP
jgi:cardiolipin synthase A/B